MFMIKTPIHYDDQSEKVDSFSMSLSLIRTRSMLDAGFLSKELLLCMPL